MKTLIIAEKPSVAQDIARALGKMKREGDHYENDEYVVAAAAAGADAEQLAALAVWLLASERAPHYPGAVSGEGLNREAGEGAL